MTAATYEHHFVTNDGPIFNMIEDESGDVFWGYGHRDADEFTGEVNRWLIHVNAATVPDDLIRVGTPVEHLWAKYECEDPDGSDRFALTRELHEHDDDEIFPVTRLII